MPAFKSAELVDAAVVRLPEAVNWYFPGSCNPALRLNPSRSERVFRGRRGQGSGPRVVVAGEGLRLRDSGGQRGSGPFGA